METKACQVLLTFSAKSLVLVSEEEVQSQKKKPGEIAEIGLRSLLNEWKMSPGFVTAHVKGWVPVNLPPTSPTMSGSQDQDKEDADGNVAG
jgi:hypothetical protein